MRAVLGMVLMAVMTTQGAAQADTVGTLIVAHGSNAEWNARIEAVAARAATGGPVAVAYLMGPGAATHRFQDQVAALVARGARRVVVVPLLVSSHSGHYEQIRWLVGATDTLSEAMHHHLHMAGIERPTAGVPLLLTRGLDDAPEVTAVLVARVRTLLAGAPAEGRAVFVIGHGPNAAEDHAEWMRVLRLHAARVAEALGAADARAGVVRDDAPAPVRAEAVNGVRDLITLQARATGQPVLVVPLAISIGRLTDTSLPRDMAGLPIVYDGTPLLPHEAIARWVARVSREAVSPQS